jgi:hypothetical protein
MAANTRPYFMTLEGVDHMVEATNPAQAVRHVVGAALTELRPARGAEVAAWVRNGNPIPIAGQKSAAQPHRSEGDFTQATTVYAGDDDAEFTAGDAYCWLADWTTVPQVEIQPLWERVVSTKRMTLEDFDSLRTAVPKLSEMLVELIDGGAGAVTVDGLRAQLEEQPMEIEVVVGLIADAKRAENFLPETEAKPVDS